MNYGKRDQLMAELYADGYSLDHVGQQFHVTRERVRQILDRQGIVRRPKWTRGKRDE